MADLSTSLAQFNEDLDDETKATKPFWRRWKFYRTTFLFLTRCEDTLKSVTIVLIAHTGRVLISAPSQPPQSRL